VVNDLREKWIIALAVIGFAVILGGSLFVGLYFFELFESQVLPQIANSNQHYPSIPNVTIANVTVFHKDSPLYQGAYKPNVITTNLTAQDYHSSTGASSLHISGWVNNTGDGTAYAGYLLVVAMNSEGKAISTTQSFAGVTAHMSVGLQFSFPYNGSAITNCTITPFYLDLVDFQNRPRP
jgi:hypothetical protein